MSNTTHTRSEYLKLIKQTNLTVKTVQISVVTAFLALWEYSAYKLWIDPFILSCPSRMVKMFIQKKLKFY